MNAAHSCLLALSLWVALPAAASEKGARVVLHFAGTATDETALRGSLRELLLRLQVELASGDVDDALATVDADWAMPDEAALRIRDASGRLVLMRKIARAGRSAVALETAAHLVQSVVEELVHPVLRPVVQAMPVMVEQAPPPAEAAEPEAPSAVGFDVGVFLVGRALGNQASVAGGAGLLLSANLKAGGVRPSLWLLAQYQIPVVVQSELVDLRVQAFQARGGVSVAPLSGDSWRIDVGLGAGVDVVGANTSSSAIPGNRLGPPRLDAVPVMTALVAGHLAASKTVDLFLAFALDVDLVPRRYLVKVGPQSEVLYSGWRVHPVLMLGGTFNFFGPDPFVSRVGGET